ncbi:MAG: hypothetical protein EB101_10145 [Chitinophagia bacterium]|nr:hypothetical protein [Chitinophagia bacterium]
MPERTHDEKEVGHQADRVDAKRQGGDVVATCADSQTVGLPGVKKVAEQDGDGRRRQDPGDDDFCGDAANRRNEGQDEQKLEEVVDEQAQQAVQISAYKPTDLHRITLR